MWTSHVTARTSCDKTGECHVRMYCRGAGAGYALLWFGDSVCVNRFILVFILSSTEKYICSDYPQIFVERLFKELYKSVLYDIFKSLYHTNFSSWLHCAGGYCGHLMGIQANTDACTAPIRRLYGACTRPVWRLY